ncbi:MAG: reverse transcriptase domain-containing protein [Anaerocolumna sp.]
MRKCGNQIMNSEQLMNEILALDNIELAVKQVKANKGSAGVDGMKVYELDTFVNSREFRKIINLIEIGEYRPKPVKMVEIPKSDGGVRMLGIPTVIDRVIQQAISQVLTKIYDHEFSDNSYGFRPGKGAHDALMQAEKYVQSGCNYVVDIDLSKFFDTISKDKLMYLLKGKIKDSQVLRLINRYLHSGMLVGEQLIKSKTELH